VKYVGSNRVVGAEVKCDSKKELEAFLLSLPNRIFPEKLIFDGKQVRTAFLDPVVALILKYSNELKGNKKGQNKYFTRLSRLVP